jgi:hypothetical protein
MMIPRQPVAGRFRVATLALTGSGALMLAGVSACADDDSSGSAPSPTPQSATAIPPPTGQSLPATSAATEPSGTETSMPAGTSAPLDDALIEKARAEGSISVIVTLGVPYTHEPLLTLAEAEQQRAAITAAQDQLAASVPNATVTARMTSFPQIVFSVDEDALRQLAASPLVLAIEENKLSGPTG